MSDRQNQPLYYADSKSLTKNDICNALRMAGVREGDIVMVHSDIGSFGRLSTTNKEFLLRHLVQAIQESIGKEGTIIMPTFTYSFLKNQPFDVQESKSTVGTLTEYFRKLRKVARTVHPTHSVAVYGKKKENFLDIGKGTFDKNSIFGKVHALNGKIVLFGVRFYKACTFVHYIEEMHGVPYRYIKKLNGTVIKNGKAYNDELLFYYRYAFVLNSFLKLEEHLLKNNLLKEVKIGNSSIFVIECSQLFEEGYKFLDRDISSLLKNDSIYNRCFNKITCFILKYFNLPVRLFYELVSKVFGLLSR